ncbi:MAG: NUDIX hydrolase N-terminal domain-containing protein [Candidatus Heimdallarchaeota archaeon]|nr:MAG: NUDIX hydrolase N-terminal domain-containing protein [Candidatus Heimdallarchaeota archaeon]
MLSMKKIALWADKLRDITAMGLKYSNNVYDQERYQKIQDIALAMFATAADKSLTDLEPLKTDFFSRPGPLVGGDAAVINDSGQILLIQRVDNSMWAMPGGLLEVGETPAEGVLREVVEETGVQCQVIALIGAFDSRFCGTTYPHHLYQLMFLCKPLNNEKLTTPSHKHESLNIEWFKEHSLPVNIDPGHISRIPEAFRVWKGDTRAFFDVQDIDITSLRNLEQNVHTK